MSNSAEIARKWTRFIAGRPEFREGQRLLEQFEAGNISRLCDCGCNSYDISVAAAGIPPLARPSERGGLAFQAEFECAEPRGTVSFLLFVDAPGNLAALDVNFSGNTEPMPASPRLVEPPFHVSGELSDLG